MPQYWVNDYPMPWLPGVFLLYSYHQVRIPSCHCKDRFVGRSLSSSFESETTLRRPDGPCVGFSRRVGLRLPGGALRCCDGARSWSLGHVPARGHAGIHCMTRRAQMLAT
mmetsp:Transcript_77834/g.202673  ORF Transcript_77834/g.202673 Transcript_77834/m.202673 type:complete len:110 (-) Transcript_77834:386-715(-)